MHTYPYHRWTQNKRWLQSILATGLLVLVSVPWITPALAESKPASKPVSRKPNLSKPENGKMSSVNTEQTIELLEWLGSFDEEELAQLDAAMDSLEHPASLKPAPADTPTNATNQPHKITGVHP